jgi:asparagine synthetase B (glutamine-hydrolysing)
MAESSLNTLLKEILENIKLISEELKHLAHNLNALELPPNSTEAAPQIPLYFLMKMAMEDTRVAFSEGMSELLFRLYILEESTSLILLKSLRVFEELAEKLNDEATSRRSSLNSEKTGKRSALSESLEVFKRNQLRLELERNDLLLPLEEHR